MDEKIIVEEQSVSLHPKYDKLERVAYRIAHGASRVSLFGMLVMIALMVADILLRLFINYTIYGVFDWVCFMMIPIGFSALSIATIRGEQVSVTLLVDHFPKCVVKVLDLLCYIISFGMTIVFIWRNIVQAKSAMLLGLKAIQFPLKTFWFYYVIAIGYALMAFVLIVMIIGAIVKWRDDK